MRKANLFLFLFSLLFWLPAFSQFEEESYPPKPQVNSNGKYEITDLNLTAINFWYESKGKYRKAINKYKKFEGYNTYSGTMYNIANCYFNLRKYKDAVEYLTHAISLDSSCKAAYNLRAQTYGKLNNNEAMFVDYKHMLGSYDSLTILGTIGFEYYLLNNYDSAFLYLHPLQNSPHEKTMALAYCYMAKRDYKNAKVLAYKVKSSSKDSTYVPTLLIDIYEVEHNFDSMVYYIDKFRETEKALRDGREYKPHHDSLLAFNASYFLSKIKAGPMDAISYIYFHHLIDTEVFTDIDCADILLAGDKLVEIGKYEDAYKYYWSYKDSEKDVAVLGKILNCYQKLGLLAFEKKMRNRIKRLSQS